MHRIVTTRATREEKSLLADASHSSRDFSSLNGFESSGPSTASSVQTFTSVANRTSEAFSTLRCVDNILRFLSYVYSKKQPFKKHILRNKESNEGKKEDVYYASLSLPQNFHGKIVFTSIITSPLFLSFSLLTKCFVYIERDRIN